MTGKYGIIAMYTEGVAHFQIGRKLKEDEPLCEDNVEWKKQNGEPVRFEEYRQAEAYMNH